MIFAGIFEGEAPSMKHKEGKEVIVLSSQSADRLSRKLYFVGVHEQKALAVGVPVGLLVGAITAGQNGDLAGS